ncbi:PepSY domain-containing protein [Novosphingobium sp. KN65.2]|uniref:PepSY domain-containing protein n=1 Tax=Novosphingobium sp. KN65.2 TaxID=1478134 RepID=UPI0005DEF074|nr:PepSY domain-containing protein [Novosphingobium sp. KN65.2]CDO38332.1 exported hypothetical protein [Novosphingobium sp. KN65.2]
MNWLFERASLPFAAAALMLAGLAQAAPKPQVSKSQAQAIALRVAPGKIVKAEYERENGAWRWSFDVRQGARIHEIGVDAKTGKIVEDSFETPGERD